MRPSVAADGSASPASRAHWAGRTGLPPVVLLATVAWVGILLAYSLLVPLFRAPDELQHVGLVIASRTSPGYGDYDSTFTDVRVEAGARLLGRPGAGLHRAVRRGHPAG